jgi:peptidoglycan hydrolase-like protein with peptidoglycan-binding domain
METIAYIHLALAYETLADEDLCEQLDWQKYSNQVWLYLLPVMVVLGVLGMASETLAQTLRRGSSNPQVGVLQQNLQQLNYYSGSITGFFGSQTEAALKAFQQANGLTPDGIYGTGTEAALQQALLGEGRVTQNQPYDSSPYGSNPYESREFDSNPYGSNPYESREFDSNRFSRTLRLGASGPDVRLLQELLREQNVYEGSISGFFGSRTQAAVRQFQLENGLNVDGIAGRRTLAALESGRRSDRRNVTLRPGSFGSRVRELQERLKAAGFYTGRLDGYYGFGTEQAVRRLQRANSLAVTGIANRKTLVALLTYRFVVVVPNESSNILSRVRQSVYYAFLDTSRLGPYVNAGVFNNRALAESRSQLLRSRGLDARVVYR